MNIFMPYKNIKESVAALDNVRLNKQILECYQIYQVALGKSQGYKNHPITKHYIQYPDFLRLYGYWSCLEYHRRFGKRNIYQDYFYYQLQFAPDIEEIQNITESLCKTVNKIPLIYVQYPKTDPRCIREHDEKKVLELYQKRLSEKWNNDVVKGRPPKWTNREEPKFWEKK